jgi:hypothetical protein
MGDKCETPRLKYRRCFRPSPATSQQAAGMSIKRHKKQSLQIPAGKLSAVALFRHVLLCSVSELAALRRGRCCGRCRVGRWPAGDGASGCERKQQLRDAHL